MTSSHERKVSLMSIRGQGDAQGAVNSRTKPPRIENTKGERHTEQPCGRCEYLEQRVRELEHELMMETAATKPSSTFHIPMKGE